MYLRFIAPERDKRTGEEKGIFTLAYQLLRKGALFEHEELEIRKSLRWFGKNLPLPTKFSRKRNVSHKKTHGISWIKSDSEEALKHLWSVKSILENHGYTIDVKKTDRPGYIVYEDEHQVVAEPFHGEKI